MNMHNPCSQIYSATVGLVCWSLTSLCHSNGHIETMSAREINPFTMFTALISATVGKCIHWNKNYLHITLKANLLGSGRS